MDDQRFRVYIYDGKENIEYYRFNRRQSLTTPFPDNLMNLLYLDVDEVERIVHTVKKPMERFYMTKQSEDREIVLEALKKLAYLHPYYLFLLSGWEKRFQEAEANGYVHMSDVLPIKQITHVPAILGFIQSVIRPMLYRVLDMDNAPADQSVPERLASYYEYKSRERLYEFSTLPLNYERPGYSFFTTVLYPTNIEQIIEFSFREMLQREQRVRVCKNCGRYFALTGRANAEYCTRPTSGRGKTCREIGAVKIWERKQEEDDVFKLYRREYKRRFAWIRLKKTTPEMFYAWSEEARKKKAACERGEMTVEEFERWLKK